MKLKYFALIIFILLTNPYYLYQTCFQRFSPEIASSVMTLQHSGATNIVNNINKINCIYFIMKKQVQKPGFAINKNTENIFTTMKNHNCFIPSCSSLNIEIIIIHQALHFSTTGPPTALLPASAYGIRLYIKQNSIFEFQNPCFYKFPGVI